MPVNGFYEWQKVGKHKQPYWIHPMDQDYFALGAVWDEWHDNMTGEVITSTAIITTEANDLMKPIHDRMPVILPKESWALWLDENVQDYGVLKELMRPGDSSLMDAYTVSTRVNSPANDDAGLIGHSKAITLF